MVSFAASLLLLECIVVTLVQSQFETETMCGPQPSGMRFSVKTLKHSKGNWITKIAVKREDDSSLNGLLLQRAWNLDVDSTLKNCDTTKNELLVSFTISAPLPVRTDYELFPGVGYYKFHTDVTTWPVARQICADEDAHLVIINSEKESNVMKTLFSRHPTIPGASSIDYAWIGVERKNGSYWTIFGDSLISTGFLRWNPGDPDAGPKDNCLLVKRQDGLLADVTCEWKVAFICEH